MPGTASNRVVMPSPKQAKIQSPITRRTRHGCWTCRRRRRKCDETKPVCQNCVEKSFTCKYGVQLTFHDTNIFSLGPNEARTLRQKSPGGYKKLQFVDGTANGQDSLDKRRSDRDISPSTHPHSSSHGRRKPPKFVPKSTVNTTKPSNPKNVTQNSLVYFNRLYEAGQMASRVVSPAAHAEPCSASANRPLDDDTCIIPDTSRTAAIDLELAMVIDPLEYNTTTSLAKSAPSVIPSRRLTHQATGGAEICTGRGSDSHNAITNGMTERYLLKYFIDTVAPWLDLCHPEASYGINIPIMSSAHHPLRTAMLALAAHHCSGREYHSLAAALAESSVKALGSDIYSPSEESVATRHLISINKLLTLPMEEWKSILISVLPDPDGLHIDELLSGARGAGSWLLLRFDLAAAIDTQSPLVTDLDLFSDALSSLSTGQRHSWDTDRLQHLLLICGQSADIAFIQSTTTRNNTWIDIYMQLQAWKKEQKSRNIEESLFTAPIDSFLPPKPNSLTTDLPISFPIHILTNQISFYCSILDNIICILLIQSKPRQINDRATRSLKTAPWYAVQICGLSISNTLLWSWDPVVVSALLFAGSFLTYEGQQTELLKHLRALEEMTGWMIQGKIQKLTEFWEASR